MNARQFDMHWSICSDRQIYKRQCFCSARRIAEFTEWYKKCNCVTDPKLAFGASTKRELDKHYLEASTDHCMIANDHWSCINGCGKYITGAFSYCQRHENACLGFDFHRNVACSIDKQYNAGAKERLDKQLIWEKSKLIKRPSTKKTEEQGASSSNANDSKADNNSGSKKTQGNNKNSNSQGMSIRSYRIFLTGELQQAALRIESNKK